MTEPPCLMRNIAGRPIELHAKGHVTVLSPDATVMITEVTPEIAWLEQTGALTRHAAPAEISAAPGPSVAGAANRKRPASKAGKANSDNGVPS